MTRLARRRPRPAFLVVLALVALLVAGVGSHYASTAPDGLESAARELGFGDRERASAAERSPLAGYETDGVSDARASRGLAGVAGSLLVLALAGGLFWVLRRGSPRSTGPSDGQRSPSSGDHAPAEQS